MLVFGDEAWKKNDEGKRVGTLAAVAIPRREYNDFEDRLFILKERYWGLENARNREIKGKRLLSPYEFRRESGKERPVSKKISFAREILEEIKSREIKVFASVVFQEHEVELLCANPERVDRPYLFLMERLHAYFEERDVLGSVMFDDRGMGLNQQVALAYTNFLNRSTRGRSFNRLMRNVSFVYSQASAGVQIADLVCTVVNRFYTCRHLSPRIPQLMSIVRKMEWRAESPNDEGYMQTGIKVLGD